MNIQRVKDDMARLAEKATYENAAQIVGLIEAPVERLADEYDQAAGRPSAMPQTAYRSSNWGPRPQRGNGSALD